MIIIICKTFIIILFNTELNIIRTDSHCWEVFWWSSSVLLLVVLLLVGDETGIVGVQHLELGPLSRAFPQQWLQQPTTCCCGSLDPLSAGTGLLHARNNHQRVMRVATKETPKNRSRPDLTPWMRWVAASNAGKSVHLYTTYERSTFLILRPPTPSTANRSD